MTQQRALQSMLCADNDIHDYCNVIIFIANPQTVVPVGMGQIMLQCIGCKSVVDAIRL